MGTDFPHWIDSTLRKNFDACPTKAYWESFRKIRRKGGSVHLVFGASLARGLEVFRKEYYSGNLDVYDAFAKGCEAIIKEWGEYEAPEGDKKSLESCLLAFDSYLTQYNPAEDVVKPYMSENGDPAVEFTFAVPIPGVKHPQTGEPILYTGRFDMIGVYGGMAWVVDEKTTGHLGAGWANQWKMASQMTSYVWAAQQYGYNVEGAIIRGIGIYKTYFGHQMLIEHRQQWEIGRWLWQLQKNINRMIEMWESGEWEYSLDTACASYGGCPFMTLCSSPDPEKWIDGEYESNDWNPLD